VRARTCTHLRERKREGDDIEDKDI